MATVISVDEFLRVLRQSALVEETDLAAGLKPLQAGGPPTEARTVAGQLVKQGVLTNFQARQLLAGKWRGFTIGKYRVLELLGAGGMGQVFLCEHRQMRRLVAVKVLAVQQMGEPSAVERFYREARAVAALDHPNIVRAYDVDQDGSLHYLVMEYVFGTSLQDIVKKFGPMAPGRACHYIRQAALGLHHAHQAGWIHRDIKPGNLLLDRQGTLKILDMGLARPPLSGRDNLTQQYDENCVLGTADYLAPEQAMNSHAVDIRADIYSLGASLYFLLAGKPPFGAGTIAQKLLWHQLKTPPPIEQERPDLPAALLTVLARMLAKDPAQRYPAPAALANDLAPLCKGVNPRPSEREMPQWCPAVLRVLQAEDSARTPRSAITPVPAVARPAAQPVPQPQAAATATLTPPPRPKPRGAVPAPETLSTKNQPADDTATMEARRTKSPRKKAASRPAWVRPVVGIGAVLLLGAAGSAAVFWHGADTPPRATTPSTTVVSRADLASRPSPTAPPSTLPVINANEAARHINRTCVVRLTVRSTGKSGGGNVFLNSEKDYRSTDNFTVLIRPPLQQKLADRDIADPKEYYKGKTLRVTGQITTYNNTVQIDVTDPGQIEEVTGEG